MEVNKLVAAVGSAGLLGITCLPLSAFADMNWHSDSLTSVSYTHLTLPTKA